jgi:adenosine 3'-phospho 5'-phosphosulfate transporter B2
MPCPSFGNITRGTRGIIYPISIIGSLLVYGLWQERIMAHAYGEDYFSLSVFLVLFNRVFGIVFAFFMVGIMDETYRCNAPLWKYIAISVSTVVASICQYEALKYVSFTVQLLGKSFKMMPVMFWGRFWFRRKYRVSDWLVSVLVTAGVIWFMLSGNIQPEHNHGSSWYGIGLLIAFIVIDGFTSTFQEKLFAQYRASKYNQMLYINLVASILSVLILLISGNFKRAFNFCHSHPRLWGDSSILSGAAVVAQWFIYSQVQEFGALAFAATMNLRQIASVIGSYLAYSHPITAQQIAGLCLVFAALAMQNLSGLMAESEEKLPLVLKDEDEGKPTLRQSVRVLKQTLTTTCVPCAGRRK